MRALGRWVVPSALALALSACAESPPERPNVVLFVLDTVRSDALSANGHPHPLTPTIDRLAAEGANFTSAYAHSSWTKPSIATLFTGTFPDRHKVRSSSIEIDGRLVAQKLGPRLHTMAERFLEAGYATAGFVNQVHLRPKFGFHQGFEHYDWTTGKAAHEVNDALALWLEIAPARPLFIYIHYLDPHWPYWERVEGLREALGHLGVHPEPPRRGNQVDSWLAAGLAPGSIDGLRARYDHGVASTDVAMGQALEMLRAAGVLDDAVVAVTSDHGEGFLEHGKLQHGYAPYEEVLRVPLVIRPPERLDIAPVVVDKPVGLVDVLPTLLDLAGLPPTREGDRGRSLVPLMRRPGAATRPIYAEVLGMRSLRSGDRKLIRYADGSIEYYDLAADPGERTPLPCDDVCRELEAELELTILMAESWKDEPVDEVELDEVDIERLRALRYMSD